jgi:hypothetical protein
VSDDKGHKTAAPEAASPAAPAAAAPPPEKLSGLMAAGEKTAAKPGPDLDAEALRAAEHALSAGEKALAEARAHLAEGHGNATKPSAGRGRELALRLLLAVNIVAMVVVAMLPNPQPPGPVVPEHAHEQPAPPGRARFNEPWNRALEAAERHEFPSAVTILEQYLADNPRMAPSERLNVLGTLSTYAARAGQYDKSRDFRQKADAIEQSHSLPSDLVADAQAALARKDQEALRRIWARFLLQQRQVPGWLQKHVAEAYLQLGDSYRLQADVAAEAARIAELEATNARLRAEAIQGREKGK